MTPQIDTSAPAPGSSGLLNAKTIAELRVEMLRFARLQLGSSEACEDVVQEALEGAIRNVAGFEGKSSLKTWVFSILKHRIIDYFRRGPGAVPVSSLVGEDEEWQHKLDALFDEAGAWHPGTRPTAWPAPDEAVQSKQFWAALEACMKALPGTAGRAFMMREVLGVETAEICQQLEVTVSNLHVILHRARLKLRDCLENGWVRAGGR